MRSGYEQLVSRRELSVPKYVEVRPVINFDFFGSGDFWEPQDEKILVFEEVGRRWTVERNHLSAVTDKGAFVEAVATPLIVCLIGICAQYDDDVACLLWICHNNRGDVLIAMPVTIIDKIYRMIS